MGDVVSTLRYHPYGKTAQRTGVKPVYGFAGGEIEEEEELGLIQFGARWYAPEIGRWVSPDPLFLENPLSSVNKTLNSGLYSFAGNDPINRLDPFGLDDNPVEVCDQDTTDYFTGSESQVSGAGAPEPPAEDERAKRERELAIQNETGVESVGLNIFAGVEDQADSRTEEHIRKAEEAAAAGDEETAKEERTKANKIVTGSILLGALGTILDRSKDPGDVAKKGKKAKKALDKLKDIKKKTKKTVKKRKQVFKGKNSTQKKAKDLRDSQGKRTIKPKNKRKGKQKEVWTRQHRNKNKVGNKPDGPHGRGGRHFHDDNHLDDGADNLHTGDFK